MTASADTLHVGGIGQNALHEMRSNRRHDRSGRRSPLLTHSKRSAISSTCGQALDGMSRSTAAISLYTALRICARPWTCYMGANTCDVGGVRQHEVNGSLRLKLCQLRLRRVKSTMQA